jgi:SulP family sulfate permease
LSRVKTWAGSLYSRHTLKDDAVAGVVLGVESVPDGLASGLLAGVNPIFGLYAYMVGTVTGAVFTSSTFMAVQGTGAMAIIVSDVPAVRSGDDTGTALFTLSVLTGVIMLVAGLLKLGSLLRWVSNAVMVGFINAVGVNIVLGQLDNFSGYEAQGSNRVVRTFDLLFNLGEAHWPSMVIGTATIFLIILLERTRLGSMGMVVAIVITSAIAPLLGRGVVLLNDITEIPRSLPTPVLPDLSLLFELLIPAAALAFVGLVQGAGISSNFPNPDGTYPDASRDFVGQGAANIAAGVFQGMPVGGSMSGSSLVKEGGARTKAALIIASVVMAISVLLLGNVVGYIAMPALAGLLMLVGFRTVKPADIKAVWRTGSAQATVLAVTFALTMLIPLQTAVLAGAGISIILYVIRQSNQVRVMEWRFDDDGRRREIDPPAQVPADTVLVLQPYGSLFFAAAPVFEQALPEVTAASSNTVVVLRLRGKSDLGSTFMEVLERYATKLALAGSKLVIVSASDRVLEQLQVTGVTDVVGTENVYPADEWLGATLTRAYADAQTWVSRDDGA